MRPLRQYMQLVLPSYTRLRSALVPRDVVSIVDAGAVVFRTVDAVAEVAVFLTAIDAA